MECVEDIELKRMQDKEDFWDAQQKHQCKGCNEYDEVLWPSGYCPECAAKRKAQFTCLRCLNKKPMVAFGPAAIFCKACVEEMDAGVEEHIAYFETILEGREHGRSTGNIGGIGGEATDAGGPGVTQHSFLDEPV